MKMLLCHDADHKSKDNSDTSTLYTACSRGYDKVVQILLADPNVAKGIFSSDKLLTIRAKNDHPNIVQILLKHGAEAWNSTLFHGSALYEATNGGFVEIVEMLLRANARSANTSKVN